MAETKESSPSNFQTAYGREYHKRLTQLGADELIDQELLVGLIPKGFEDPVRLASKKEVQGVKEKKENPNFHELRSLLSPEQWDEMAAKLKAINPNELVTGPDGVKTEGPVAFAELAANLKEFNPKQFSKVFVSLERSWLDCKSELYGLQKKPELLWDFLVNLKALYPLKFLAQEVRIREEAWQKIVQQLKSAEEKGDWVCFLETYGKAAEFDKAEIFKRFPISRDLWLAIMECVSEECKDAYLFCREVAIMQNIKPKGFEEFNITPMKWHQCVSAIYARYGREKDPGLLVKRARAVKYLRFSVDSTA